MKNIFKVLVFSLLVFACKNEVKKEVEVEATPKIALADFNKEAANWVGKEVEVAGIVDHVCKHGGKKILLVDDNGDVHVTGEKRFEESLVGDSITVKGIVKEFVIDEAYCSKQEGDVIQKHKEGEVADSVKITKMAFIQKLRDSMKTQGVDHFSEYSIEYVSHKVKK